MPILLSYSIEQLNSLCFPAKNCRCVWNIMISWNLYFVTLLAFFFPLLVLLILMKLLSKSQELNILITIINTYFIFQSIEEASNDATHWHKRKCAVTFHWYFKEFCYINNTSQQTCIKIIAMKILLISLQEI